MLHRARGQPCAVIEMMTYGQALILMSLTFILGWCAASVHQLRQQVNELREIRDMLKEVNDE